MGMDIRQTNWPSRHKGALGWVLEGEKFKSLGKLSDWHQLWFTSANSSGNGHRLNTSRPQYPRWHFGGGGVRVSQIQKSGETVRLAPTLVHVCGFIWEWTQAKSNLPFNTPGGIWRVVGHQYKCFGEAVKRLDRLAPNLVQICGFVWEST